MRQFKTSKSITPRESNAIKTYLHEIGKTELLKPDEEVSLSQKIRAGDQQALEKLVKANLRFVVSVAKKYQHRGLSLSDLINEGNIGLIKAAQRFDETKGFKFISYAVWRIRQSISSAIALQARIVRLPLNKVGLSRKIEKVYKELEQQYEREPSASEIAEFLDIDAENVDATLNLSGGHRSLDETVGNDDDSITLGDTIIGVNADIVEAFAMEGDLRYIMQQAITSLRSQKAQDAVRMYFGFSGTPMSHEDIGTALGVTPERTRQIINASLDWLRKSSKFKNLLWGNPTTQHLSPSSQYTHEEATSETDGDTMRTPSVQSVLHDNHQNVPQENNAAGENNKQNSIPTLDDEETKRRLTFVLRECDMTNISISEVAHAVTPMPEKQSMTVSDAINALNYPATYKKRIMHFFVATDPELDAMSKTEPITYGYYRVAGKKRKADIEKRLGRAINFIN